MIVYLRMTWLWRTPTPTRDSTLLLTTHLSKYLVHRRNQ